MKKQINVIRPCQKDKQNDPIGILDTVSSVTPTSPTPEIVTLEIMDWIQQIKTHHANANTADLETAHWKKKALESALLCGDYLVKCRRTLNNGLFTKFVETHLSHLMCYKTATRYMKLFNAKDELDSSIQSLRSAYIRLGVIKELNDTVDNTIEGQVYLYPQVAIPKVEDEPTVPSLLPTPVKRSKQVKPKLKQPYRVLPELVLVLKPCTSDIKYKKLSDIEFQFADNGNLLARDLIKGSVTPLSQAGIDDLYHKLTPFLRWYSNETRKRTFLINEELRAEPISLEDPKTASVAA
ncbi:MAG: hypothetical protein EXS31_02540 [Pedosphaera sp.]|nr:hypothetical protein [Pedosphaera sp.]